MGKGEAYSIASAIAWALGVILYKRLGERLPPLVLNLRKNALVLAMMLPALAYWYGLAPPATATRDVVIALASGALGIGLADTLYFRALNQLGAGHMGIIGNFFSPFVIVLSFAFLGERLSLPQLVGFALVTIGVVVISRSRRAVPIEPAHLRRGIALGICAVLVMAIAIVMVKPVLERNDLAWISALRLAGGVLGMVAANLWVMRAETGVATPALDRRGWLLLLAAAFVGQLLSMLLWLGGYKYTTASISAILNESASVFIVLFAWLFLREPLGRARVVGVAFTISGVVFMLRG